MAKKFTDNAFLNAVANTSPVRGQVEAIANRVGCSMCLAGRRLKALVASGQLEGHRSHSYDSQPDPYGQGLFGGAGVCIRRYWVFTVASK